MRRYIRSVREFHSEILKAGKLYNSLSALLNKPSINPNSILYRIVIRARDVAIQNFIVTGDSRAISGLFGLGPNEIEENIRRTFIITEPENDIDVNI